MTGLWLLGLLLLTTPVVSLDTLFSFSDPIAQFVGLNFSTNVYGSDTAWVIDFYATWCGHCQRFAPAWRQLAYDVKDWKGVIRVGAVSCSDSNNHNLCTSIGIWGYPTIKFFPVKAAVNHKGQNYRGTKSQLTQHMVEYVTNTPVTSRPASWPKLHPVSALSEATRDITSNITSAFVIFEDSTDSDTKYVGLQVILDLSSHDGVLVRRMNKSKSAPHRIQQFPSLYKLSPSGQLTLVSSARSRNQLTQAIKSNIAVVTTPEPTTPEPTTPEPTTPEPTTATTPRLTTVTIRTPQRLHMQDLESSLYYSLWLEVPKQRVIQGAALSALKDHVKLLAKYYPGRTVVKNFLKRMSQWLQRRGSVMSAARWRRRLDRIQARNAHIPKRVIWTGCRGSQPRYRGYPCSLWMTFHALTVNAYLKDAQEATYKPEEVLLVMREYIRNFFGCRNCADHFTNMSANVQQEVPDKQDGVLWLWSRHNRVNTRLSGRMSEDPQNPKIQFPPPSGCAVCRTREGTEFNNSAILNYLLTFYRSEGITQDVMPYTSPTSRPATTRITTTSSCLRNVTPWSACSRQCGTGLSSRYSNDYDDCVTRKELQICQIRPCGDVFPPGSNCEDTFQMASTGYIRYNRCHSSETFQQKFCGSCPDKCCYPSQSEMKVIEFTCRRVDRTPPTTTRMNLRVLFINTCSCAATCPSLYTT